MSRIAVVSELGWPVRRHYDLTNGIEDYASGQGGWQLEVGPYPDCRIKRGHHFDGIVGRITPEILASANEHGIAVVNTWLNSPVANEIPSVFVDPAEVGRIAAEHLHGLGFDHLVQVGCEKRLGPALHYEGFLGVASEMGCTVSRLEVRAEYESSSDEWDAFITTLETAAETWPESVGIAVWSDDLGRAVVTELRGLGWALPGKVAVVSANNDFTYCNIYPSLSSVDLGYQRNGYEAARLLHALIAGKPPPKEPILIPPSGLVVRQTSERVTDHVSRSERWPEVPE